MAEQRNSNAETAALNGLLTCFIALREAEAHIRATAHDFSGAERAHHLMAADKAAAAIASFRRSMGVRHD